MNSSQIVTKKRVLYCCAVLGVVSMFTELVNATRDVRSQRDDRAEEMRQEARTYTDGIDRALKAILEPTVKNQRPTEAVVQGAQSTLDESKRFASVFDDNQKAEFMLLQGWTSYYQGNVSQALNWSARSCRTNQASQDAWNSQALFSLLGGKRPLMPRIETPRARQERPERINSRPRRNQENVVEAPEVQPYSQKGTLEFDLLGIRSDMLREQFSRQEFVSIDGQTIRYTPQQNTLCILFWQSNVTPNNQPGPAGAGPQGLQRPVNFVESEISRSFDTQKTTLEAQRNYVNKLKNACSNNPEIQFIQINTDQSDGANAAATEAASDALVEQAGPLVLAADPASNARKFAGLKAETPFFAVVDKEGKVKYAGTASGFIPAFILTELTGVDINLAQQNQQNQQTASREMTDPRLIELGMREIPSARTVRRGPLRTTDPNAPDPNSVTPVRRPVSREQDTLLPEDQLRAEYLLQLAQLHIEQSRNLPMDNPGEGIKAAREVLEKYPNTEYAQQARELLRRVPSQWKERHNITDEELGI